MKEVRYRKKNTNCSTLYIEAILKKEMKSQTCKEMIVGISVSANTVVSNSTPFVKLMVQNINYYVNELWFFDIYSTWWSSHFPIWLLFITLAYNSSLGDFYVLNFYFSLFAFVNITPSIAN